MKKTLTLFVGFLYFSVGLFAQNGVADASFNGTGKIDATYETANGICVDKDDKVLVIGHDRISSTKNIFVHRYLTNGTLDNSFGSGGRFLFDLNSDYDYGRCVKALPNGKYLISGQNSVGPYFRSLVARINSNGTLDNSFGVNGVCIISPNPANCDAWSFEVSESGSIYVAGYRTVSGTLKSVLWKVKPNGTIDQSFGTSGEKIINTNAYSERLYGIDLKNNTIAVAGWSHNGTSQESIVALLDTNGNLLSSFNSTGYKKIVSASKPTYITDVAITGNGLAVSGYYDDNGFNQATVVSYLMNGSLNTSFATSGVYIDNLSNVSEYPEILANCDDELFVGGYYENSNGDMTFRVSKLLPDGTLESGFGTSGHFSTRIKTSYGEAIEAMAFAGDDGLVFGGRTNLGTTPSRSGIVKILIEACSASDISPVNNVDFNVYPNPLGKSGALKIDFNGNIGQDIQVSIFSTEGKLVFDEQLLIENNQLCIDNLDLAAGVYQIVLNAGDKQYAVKLVIQ